VEQPDAIIHQPVRLKIVAALKVLPQGERLEFVRLKAIVQATEGNLGAHLGTLEGAGYLKVEKDFYGKKPRTRVSLTDVGRRAFSQYVAYLRRILDDGEAAGGSSSRAD
jgi:DNA-binding MarR family transcriptional regulator